MPYVYALLVSVEPHVGGIIPCAKSSDRNVPHSPTLRTIIANAGDSEIWGIIESSTADEQGLT